MPSGAKKRKAAKKKKEQAANSSATNNTLGNDDPKSQDERDSDGGDAGSPASQDHHHPFSQEEDEGKRAQSHVTGEKSVKEATKNSKSTEKSGKGWEAKKDLESTDVSIQHVEHDKTRGSSSSSSSSSSDDKSQASEKKSKGEACNLGSEVASYSSEDISATVFSEEAPKVAGNETLENVDSNPAVETVAVDNSVKLALPVAEEVDISANNSVPDKFESRFESEEKILLTSNGISGVEGSGSFTSSDIPPPAETSNAAEKYQASERHDNSEKQPLVASTPPPPQRTSLLSCCGLFEVFTGSGR